MAADRNRLRVRASLRWLFLGDNDLLRLHFLLQLRLELRQPDEIRKRDFQFLNIQPFFNVRKQLRH